jgi:putative peptide zinc metalloprotease protein
MNESITPRLRADVLVQPFDEHAGDNRFIVAVDGKHFVVSAAVAAVLVESRAHTTLSALAERASLRLGVTVSTDLASSVLNEQLLAICFHAPEQRAESECPIRFRARVFGERALKAPLAVLSFLFTKPAAVALILALVVVELLITARSAGATPHTLSGTQVVCAGALTLLGIIVHELGHLAACARFGAAHGGIGMGLYWCMPVFYAEVNGAWMLPRLQRAVVDVGGIYLQCAYVVTLGAVYLATGAAAALEAIVWSHFLMLHTLNPVLKYDGYWLLTDLAGAPNLHAQIRESARSSWRAARALPEAQWPDLKALALLGAFAGIAVAYFAYVLAVLGANIGHSAGASAHRWADHVSTPFGTWHAVGESAVLALLVVMAVSLAFLLARSIHRIGRDTPT